MNIKICKEKKTKKLHNIKITRFMCVFSIFPLSQIVISCNTSQKKFDQVFDNKIVFGTTYEKDHLHYRAIENVIKKYNEVMANMPNYVPVELRSIGENYMQGQDLLHNDLESKNSNNFYNLVSLPNTAASLLSSYDMLLNFRDDNPEFSLKNNKILQKYQPKILNRNTQKNIFSIPLFKSTDVLTINGPIMGYIFEILEKNGIQIENDFKTFVNKIKAASLNDRETIKTLWGNPKNDINKLANNYKIKTIGYHTFSSFKELLSFSELIQNMFENTNDQKLNLHALGINDISSVINTISYASINANKQDFYTQIKNINGVERLSFENFRTVDKKISKNSSEIFDDLKTAIRSRALTIKNDDTYTSIYQVMHKYAMTISSSAGYEFYFHEKSSPEKDKTWLNEDELFALPAPSKYLSSDEKNVIYSRGSSIIGIHANEKEDLGTKLFVKWLTESETKYEFPLTLNGNTTTFETPTEHVSRMSSYVFPINQNVNEIEHHFNSFTKLGNKLFQKILTDKNYELLEDIADNRISEFNSKLNAAYVATYNKIKNNEIVKDYQTEIINSLIFNLKNR